MKILICEDHEFFRTGICNAIRPMLVTSVFSEASDGIEAMQLLRQQAYDVVLMDINLPGKSGLQLLEEIKLQWPQTHVLMLSQYEEKNYALRAIKMGASGYLNKNISPAKLVEAIKTVVKGEIFVSTIIAAQMAEALSKNAPALLHDALSEREFEVMLHLANGKTLQEIAKLLLIQYNTISTYQARIFNKLGLKNVAELVKYCLANGLIQ